MTATVAGWLVDELVGRIIFPTLLAGRPGAPGVDLASWVTYRTDPPTQETTP